MKVGRITFAPKINLKGKEEDKMKKEYIMIHHSLTKDSETVSWGAIRRYHTQLGWRDIGYHFGIEDINGTQEILMGRMMHDTGAHCKEDGMNRKAISICIIGNFDNDFPSKEQWDKAVALAASIALTFGICNSNIIAHRDYAPYKSCPGLMFDMEKFRDDVAKYLGLEG